MEPIKDINIGGVQPQSPKGSTTYVSMLLLQHTLLQDSMGEVGWIVT